MHVNFSIYATSNKKLPVHNVRYYNISCKLRTVNFEGHNFKAKLLLKVYNNETEIYHTKTLQHGGYHDHTHTPHHCYQPLVHKVA